MEKFNSLDIIRVVAGGQLSSDDIQVLSLLYQPLIGLDGFALYFTLFNIIDRQEMTTEKIILKEILDFTNFKLNQFVQAKNKIEAVGLLRTLKSQEDYIFFLNLPLAAKTFMSGDLAPFLYSELGDTLFKKIMKKLTIKKIDHQDYIEVTHTFDDVFESHSVKINTDDLFLEKKRGIIKINNDEFDMDSFLGNCRTIIDRRKATDRFKNSILRIAYTYGFDYQEMANICFSCFNGSMVDMNLLTKKAREYYQNKNKVNTPVLLVKEAPETCNDEQTKILMSLTPNDILKSTSGMAANISELKNIQEIWDKTEWPKGVINAFVMYILKKKDGQLPSLNYLDKVAQEWKRSGIDTTEKAAQFLQQEREHKQVKKSDSESWIDSWYEKLGESKDE